MPDLYERVQQPERELQREREINAAMRRRGEVAAYQPFPAAGADAPRVPLIDRPGIIAVCSGDRTTYPQFASVLATIQRPQGTLLHWQLAGGGALARARNAHAQTALEYNAGWIWFIDDDHVFSSDVLMRLLAHDKDLTVPIVLMRTEPFRWVAWEHFPVPRDASDADLAQLFRAHPCPPYRLLPWQRGGLIELGAAGTAGLLISAEVLRALKAPWFQFGKFGGDSGGEDVWFHLCARRAGFKIFCDVDTPLGHLAPMAIWPAGDLETGHITARLDYGVFTPAERRIHSGFPEAAVEQVPDGVVV
jgi:hypothetical protein